VSLRRATGQATFAGDISLPGLLQLALRRSPLAHARVLRADASAARALPGIAAVLVAGEPDSPLPALLRYVGDRVAVAAAEELDLARRAVESIPIELEPLTAVLDVEAALRDEAQVAARVSVAEGDVDGALSGAEHVVEGEWSLPFTPAVPLEPPLAVTWLDEDRRLVVRTSADSPFRVRGALADRLSLPAARIRVVRPHVAGGSFGRSEMTAEELCARVTLRTGRPARLALSAEEELTTAPGRPAQRVRVRLGTSGGRLVALDVRLCVDVGADGEGAAELLRSSGRHALGLYRVPAVRFEAVAARTNLPPASAPRGADAGAAFAVECAVDEAASRLGDDPAAFRRRHLRSPGDPGGQALVALGELPGQDDTRAAAELLPTPDGARPRWPLPSGGGPRRRATGLGLARRLAGAEGRAAAAANLRLLDDGSFTLAAGLSAAGGADEAAWSEAAAAILGVPTHAVVCAAADTDTAPFEAGEPAPAEFAAGRAVEEAARLLREQIREAGAGLLGVPAAEATVTGGTVRGQGGAGRAVSFAEIGSAALRAGRPLAATAAPLPESAPASLAAVLAEVELDEETGVVRVLRLTASLGGGPFADPRGPESRVEGALVGAMEQALAGGLGFDAEGRPLVRSLRRWPLVAALDVPPLSVAFFPAGDPLSRFGAGSLGDTAGRAALAAIVNATSRAAAVRLRELPLGPATLLSALEPPARR